MMSPDLDLQRVQAEANFGEAKNAIARFDALAQALTISSRQITINLKNANPGDCPMNVGDICQANTAFSEFSPSELKKRLPMLLLDRRGYYCGGISPSERTQCWQNFGNVTDLEIAAVAMVATSEELEQS